MMREGWAREAHTSHNKRAGPTTEILASCNVPVWAFCSRDTTKRKAAFMLACLALALLPAVWATCVPITIMFPTNQVTGHTLDTC